LASSMDQLERTAVQSWEAKRLAEYEDVAHGRLAMLLLDNAAETCLMRSTQTFTLRCTGTWLTCSMMSILTMSKDGG
jgi:hypothetical protein